MAKLFEPSLHLTENMILQHTTKYHIFCKWNGYKFSYGGDMLKKIIRLKKMKLLSLEERKKLRSDLWKENKPES